ncbi:MAG: dethiobiotin synthase [Desulfocapsaceae bacterium]|nr:dethiobiotin synthase [Desulfocapsaceae bacterium]
MIDHKIICITGIDTDIGKSIVTGLLAKFLVQQGYRVITQKICQTGCTGVSEDILLHRKIMGIELTEADTSGLTCPYIFPEPCSPHLAAALEQQTIDLSYVTACTRRLAANYDIVLLEGVGGLMVPLTPQVILIDYLKKFDYKHVLVSSGRLGSINHTLSALEILKNREISLLGIAYNLFGETAEVITKDTRKVLKKYLNTYGYADKLVDIAPYHDNTHQELPDFSKLIKQIGQVR